MRTVRDHHAQIVADRVLCGMASCLIGGAVGVQNVLVGSNVIRHKNVGNRAESDPAGAFEAGPEAPAVQGERNIAHGQRVVGFGFQRKAGMEGQRLRQGINKAVGTDRGKPGSLISVISYRVCRFFVVSDRLL